MVSDEVGGWNEWDVRRGAAKLPMLTAGQLTDLAGRGWSIGAHSRTHSHLPPADPPPWREELGAPWAALPSLGLPVERVLAYPHGEHDARVRAAARRAGYAAAF